MKTVIIIAAVCVALATCQSCQQTQQVQDEKACDVATLDFNGVDPYAVK